MGAEDRAERQHDPREVAILQVAAQIGSRAAGGEQPAPEPETLLLLAPFELRNPKWTQRGVDRLRHAVAVDPRFTPGWLELANFWKVRGHADKLRECLDRILAYDSEDEDVQELPSGEPSPVLE